MAALTFRALAPADLPMLHGWLQRPHVAAWWHEPRTLGAVESDYFSAEAAASSTRAFIALLDGDPLGFIQSYTALGAGDGWWEDETDPGTRGIDQFLADESGSAAASAVRWSTLLQDGSSPTPLSRGSRPTRRPTTNARSAAIGEPASSTGARSSRPTDRRC